MATQIVKPDLPSSVVRWGAQAKVNPTPSFSEVVAVPIVADWGPMGADVGARLYTSFPAYEADFGTDDTAGRDAVLSAFNGTGQSGAGGVYVYRMATNSAAKATGVVTNTTPATALSFSALYKGARGNLIGWVTEDDPVLTGNDRLRILFNGVTVESYSYLQTDVDALVAAITARPSRYLAATRVITGTALSHGSGTLTGGDDGSTLDATAWQAAQDAFEYKSFGLFAPYNLVDPSITAQVATWVKEAADDMRPFRAFFGGASGETVDEAIAVLNANSGLLRDPHIVRLAVGTFHDDLLDKDVSTAQLAPRLAGIAAARGMKSALTNARAAGLRYVGTAGLSKDERILARDQGLTTFTQVSDVENELAITQGVTTFTAKNVEDMPYELFSEPRIIGLLDYVVRRMRLYGAQNIIGNTTVTDDTRIDVAKEVSKLLRFLEDEQLAEPGTSTVSVLKPEDPALNDAVPYDFGFQPTRTANYLIGNGRLQ